MGPLRTLPGWAWTPFAEAGFFFLVRLPALLIVLLRTALLALTFSALLVLLLTLIGHHVLLELRSMVTLPKVPDRSASRSAVICTNSEAGSMSG
jgi:hypothetical protein